MKQKFNNIPALPDFDDLPLNLKCDFPLKLVVAAGGGGLVGVFIIVVIVCIVIKCKKKNEIVKIDLGHNHNATPQAQGYVQTANDTSRISYG